MSYTNKEDETTKEIVRDIMNDMIDKIVLKAEEEEDDEDDWEDITHCHLTYTKKNNIVSTKLQMAGGGSHAWWYVLYWNSGEEEPEVYIETLNNITHTNKTLFIRQENGGSGRECQSVKLVDFESELPRNNNEYHYHCFSITDDLYDAVEEEEDEDEDDEEECTDANRCEACTYCARTKVCGDCGCVGGCYSSCCDEEEDEDK